MKHWLPVALIALGLTGCGARPGATLAARQLDAPYAVTFGSTLDHPKVGDDEVRQPGASHATGDTAAMDEPGRGTTAAGGAAPRGSADHADDGDAPDDTSVPDETGPIDVAAGKDGATADKDAAAAPDDKGAAKSDDGPVKGAAGVMRTDAVGRPYAAASYTDPVYLSPTYFPILVPGSPAPLPAYSPHVVDTANLPTDAFVALADQGRLRERKAHFMKWLFGYGYPKIAAAAARGLLASGQTVYLAPDGSRLHFARTYVPETSAAPLDAMLPQLRADAATAAQRAARDADITDRMAILPSFNGTFDVVKLLLLEAAVEGYSYDGQPVRRGLVTAANLYEFASVRRAIATYWEDHPTCTAAELRQVAARALEDKLRAIDGEAASLAEMPTAYADARAIPGLRDPRPIVDGDRWAHDADVQYNKDAIHALTSTMPLLLGGCVYP